MLKKCITSLLVLAVSGSLVSCADVQKQQAQTEDATVDRANISFSIDSTEAEVKSTDTGNFALHELVPITKDGKTVAFLKLNQSERLGISDWSSSQSNDSGLKFSYTFNFKVRYLNRLDNGEMLTFYVKPKFVDISTGKDTGIPCIVGWSGFPQTAVFDKKISSTYIEYGVQPIKKMSKNTRLVADITDSAGNTYDSVTFEHSVLAKAIKGPSLRSKNDLVTITGASGAKYDIGIYDVFLEPCFTEMYNFTDPDQVQEVPRSNTLMFNYYVKYLRAPTKSIEVSNIDNSKKSKLLSTDLTIGVQSNADDTVYYDRSTRLTRWKYSDSLKLEYFCVNKRYNIHPKTYAYYTETREISDSFYTSTDHIRFSLEFNSEALAMKPEQLMKFNGRFIVFDRTPKKRSLVSKKTHKSPYAAYTSDKNFE